MTNSVNGAGPSSEGWLHQLSSKASKAGKALKGFLHFGKVTKTKGQNYISKAAVKAHSKPEQTSVHKRDVRPAQPSELASIRLLETLRQSTPISSPTLPLLESDPVQEEMYELQMEVMDLHEKWETLNDATNRASALKRKAGKQLAEASKKANIGLKEAMNSPKLTGITNRFLKAIQMEKAAEQARFNIETEIDKREIAIERLEAAENREAELELVQLLAGDH